MGELCDVDVCARGCRNSPRDMWSRARACCLGREIGVGVEGEGDTGEGAGRGWEIGKGVEGEGSVPADGAFRGTEGGYGVGGLTSDVPSLA